MVRGRGRLLAPNPRARARGARRCDDGAGGASAAVVCDSTPVSTTALRGLMASLAVRSARPWRAMACEIELRGARPAPAACAALGAAAGGRQAAADVDGLLVAIGRCWRRRGSAPGAGDDGPPRRSVRPTRHSPPHGDIADAAVAARPPAVRRGSATGSSPTRGIERSAV